MDSQSGPQDRPSDDAAELLPPARARVEAPVGADATAVSAWFDTAVEADTPVLDGTLAAERDAAQAYARMAKAENTRRAYRAAVRAWCAWCLTRNLPPLPAAGADVAAFLAGERAGKNLSPETIKLRRAGIRYLHRAAGCPVPTDDVCVSETLAGIQRDAARNGQLPRKKVAATVTILRRLLVPIPQDLRGLRDRALLLVGFAGALRRSELAAIRLGTSGEDRPRHPADPAAQQGLAGQRRDGSPALRRHRALPGARPGAPGLQAASHHRRPGVSADLAAGPRRAANPGRAATAPAAGRIASRAPGPGPSPAPDRHRRPLRRRPWRSIVQARAVAAGFGWREFGGHSLKRGALTTGMERGVHPAKLKRLGRHKSFDVLGEYLEFGDLFEGHPLSGVL